MLISDPISDLLIRIKNGLMAHQEEVRVPHSKLKEAIALKLKDHQYLEDVAVEEKKPQNELVLKLRYVDKLPAISGFKRISKPGRRLYAKADRIPVTLNGYGITLITTSQGVLTDNEARQKNIGGELICQIW